MSYLCNVCNKEYSSYQSLWNHNKTYHIIKKKIAKQINDPFYYCTKCNSKFVNKYTLQSHIKLNKCIDLNNYLELNQSQKISAPVPIPVPVQIPVQTQEINTINNDEIKLKLEQTKLEMEKIKLEHIRLEIEKIDKEKEFLEFKINNKLATNTNTNSNNSVKSINNLLNSNNTNSNNNITNNFKIYNLGSENVLETLTLAEKKEIIKARFSCLETATEIITCGKYNQFKNIILTNLKDEYAFKFDRKLNKFICGDKNEIMSEFIDERLGNIKEIFEELDETNKIDPQTKKLINDFFTQMDDDESKYTDQSSGKTWKNFRTFKEHNVKVLVYNNSDQNTKDLAIILGDKKINTDVDTEAIFNQFDN